jgi:glutamate-1-semialdehyde 2,1-aminomutase
MSDWRARAARVVPGGASTGSKRPAALFGPHAPADAPTHYVRAHGCRVVATDGREYVDLIAALGAVAFGYADAEVDDAALRAARDGASCGLPSVHEVTLAERLTETIPSAQAVRFLKSGAEACQAAVRIARAHTGRSLVLGSGYFGWLDWWNPDVAGVPSGAAADWRALPFDDIAAWGEALDDAGDRLAAVIVEPLVERWASAAWLRLLRERCDAVGAVLILDEIKTCCRLHVGGAQARLGVTPHLTTIGKAIANGWPLAAVVGDATVMGAATRTWISSTLAGETTALAAAHAVLDRHAREDVCATLARTGAAQRAAVRHALDAHGLHDVADFGDDAMWGLRWPDEGAHDRFLAAARERGVLFKRGAYQFAMLAHDAEAIARIADAATHAAQRLASARQGDG